MKRFLTAILCIAILAGLIVVPASAEDSKTYTYTYEQVSDPERKDNSKPLPPQPEVTDDPGLDFMYTISPVFTNNMVLQRDKVIRVWGTADECDTYIYGELLGEKRYAKVQDDGDWFIEFSPKEYTTTGTTLKIYNKAGRGKTFTNVLIGDVWFVAGQSNAEFTFAQMEEYYKDEATKLVDSTDKIRIFFQTKGDYELASRGQFGRVWPINPAYRWQAPSLSAVRPFSALGYVFVKKLYDETGIPQGIVEAAVGGARLCEFYTDAVKDSLPYCWTNMGAFWFAWGEDQVIYNLFMHPFKHMTIQGILFYQGETDNVWTDDYARFLKACVKGWRDEFDSDFDFYNVQLTSHAMCTGSFPYLPQVRAEQLDAYYDIPNSYIIPSIDSGWRTGRDEDIAHPFDKITPGTRAANTALASYYKKAGYSANDYCAPVPAKMTWSGSEVTIDFANVGSGLKSVGGALKGFMVKYIDDTEKEASAVIVDSDTVKVTLPSSTKKPIAVEYAIIHDAMLTNCNLVSGSDIPVPTFRLYNENDMRETDFYKSLFLDANYTTGSIEDATGNSRVNDYGNLGKGITFIDDSTVGQKVAHFNGAGLNYTIDDVKVKNNFTLEAYVKVETTDWGIICGTYYKQETTTPYEPILQEYGWALQMGKNLNFGDGAENNFSILETCGFNGDAQFIGGKGRAKWMHIVYTNDGETGRYYVDGVLKTEAPVLSKAYVDFTKNSYGDFKVGAYRPWDCIYTTKMDCAFIRLFNSAATEDQAKALYDARNTGELPKETDVMRGDVNLDGRITSADYLSLRLYFKGRYEIKGEKALYAADVNADGNITSTDYLKLKRIFAGYN